MEGQDALKTLYIMSQISNRSYMHNIRSQNQLAEWKHLKEDYCLNTPQDELIDDYFNCIVNADGHEQEKICQELLC